MSKLQTIHKIVKNLLERKIKMIVMHDFLLVEEISPDDTIEIMPEEPTSRPHKSVDIDIAVDD